MNSDLGVFTHFGGSRAPRRGVMSAPNLVGENNPVDRSDLQGTLYGAKQPPTAASRRPPLRAFNLNGTPAIAVLRRKAPFRDREPGLGGGQGGGGDAGARSLPPIAVNVIGRCARARYGGC
eukprot:145072-Prorocentrum_minimum.AAC.1